MTDDVGSAAGGAQAGWEERITIVISDGQEMVRTGLCLLLEREPDMVIVADVPDGGAADALTAFDPDVLVLDLGPRGPASLAAVPALREAHPRCAIVVLALHGDPELARETLGLGASAFVVKSAPGVELIGAIRLVAAGRTFLSPELGAQLAIDSGRRHGRDEPGGRELSRRELEVLKLIGRGHTNAEIANQLYLSVRTVESHRAHIQQKLGRTGRAELVAHARGLGLI